jgi:hypothetical protein
MPGGEEVARLARLLIVIALQFMLNKLGIAQGCTVYETGDVCQATLRIRNTGTAKQLSSHAPLTWKTARH